MLIPIRTETSVRAVPWANAGLIFANILLYLAFNYLEGRWPGLAEWETGLVFNPQWPRLHQFVTSLFMHASPMHLGGNMLFLWVFGNAVNGKLGTVPYLLFYFAGGIFATWGYGLTSVHPCLGASGAIAAVTGAYLALFPRSHVRVLFFFFLITTFDVPAVLLILLKVILWDNVLAPALQGGGNVAHSAHLAGYAFGFGATMLMLWFRALPRDLYDMPALWNRWRRRRAFAAAMSDPEAQARARFGSVARVAPSQPAQAQTGVHDEQMDAVTDLRTRIAECLARGDPSAASHLYERLMSLDREQCLPEKQQLSVARTFYESGRSPQAALAFERFLTSYPRSGEAVDVRLLLGIIYARDLHQYAVAEEHLAAVRQRLRQGGRLQQCDRWLNEVRAALGKPGLEEGSPG